VWRHDHAVAGAAAVPVQEQQSRHLLGRRHKSPAGVGKGQRGFLAASRTRRREHALLPIVKHRQPGAPRGRLHREKPRVARPDRDQQSAGEEPGEILFPRHLGHASRHQVTETRVGVAAAGLRRETRPREVTHGVGKGAVGPKPPAFLPPRLLAGEPRRMGKQLAHQRRPARGGTAIDAHPAELRQIPVDRVVPTQPAFGDEDSQQRRGEGLRDRRDAEGRVDRERIRSREVRPPEGLPEHRLAAV